MLAMLGTVLAVVSLAQDAPEPKKLKSFGAAYEKAVAYCRSNLNKCGFPSKMIVGWLLLADGRFPQDLEGIIESAKAWDRNRKGIQHAQNWFPALAGVLLSEYYRHNPKDDIKEALQAIVDEFVKNQEKTGGWFKWFEGAVKDMPGYPVRDLGFLDGMILGFLYGAKKHGCKVPESTLQNGERCLQGITSARGISYGTGQNYGDPTGARGGFMMLGLDIAGMRSHNIWNTYSRILPECIPKMDKGHHIGAFHCLGLTLGCRLIGQQTAVFNHWAQTLVNKQDKDGGLYIGDDGADGGESGLLGSNIGSTAAFGVLLLMQDPNVFKKPAPAKGGAPANNGSPFSQKKPPPKK
jgi:hypothetical protein